MSRPAAGKHDGSRPGIGRQGHGRTAPTSPKEQREPHSCPAHTIVASRTRLAANLKLPAHSGGLTIPPHQTLLLAEILAEGRQSQHGLVGRRGGHAARPPAARATMDGCVKGAGIGDRCRPGGRRQIHGGPRRFRDRGGGLGGGPIGETFGPITVDSRDKGNAKRQLQERDAVR